MAVASATLMWSGSSQLLLLLLLLLRRGQIRARRWRPLRPALPLPALGGAVWARGDPAGRAAATTVRCVGYTGHTRCMMAQKSACRQTHTWFLADAKRLATRHVPKGGSCCHSKRRPITPLIRLKRSCAVPRHTAHTGPGRDQRGHGGPGWHRA